MAVEITDSNFQETVLNSDKPVLVDFWARGVVHVECLVQSLKNFTEIMTEKL
jgi:thioredoxin-like negative regulator of GroEL